MKRILSLASFVCAILFAAAGMMMPPQGEISGSVLILVAQLLILCATFLGIKDYRDIINRKLSWLKILKTSGASSSTSLWPPSLPFSRLLVSPSDDMLPLANPWTALCGSWVFRFQVSWFRVKGSGLRVNGKGSRLRVHVSCFIFHFSASRVKREPVTLFFCPPVFFLNDSSTSFFKILLIFASIKTSLKNKSNLKRK